MFFWCIFVGFYELISSFTSKAPMITVCMPSNRTDRDTKQRQVFFSEKILADLEARKELTDAPVTAQIRRAIQDYLETPHLLQHKMLTTAREAMFTAIIPDDLWDALRVRKKETGLGLNDAVQVAVALMLQNESASQSQSQSQSQTADLTLTPPEPRQKRSKAPLSEEDEARFRELAKEVFQEEKQTLYEQLKAENKEVWPGLPAIIQPIFRGWLKMEVICGPGSGDLENLVEPLGEGKLIEITGRLAAKATEHSFFARANGWSMSNPDSEMDVRPNDILLIVPFEEYKKPIKAGLLLLVEVEFENQGKVNTLKVYTGKELKANNPNFKGIDLGPGVKTARIIAVCPGAMERIWDE